MLSQRLSLSLRLRLNLHHFIITFSRTNHVQLFSSHSLSISHKKLLNSSPRPNANHYRSPVPLPKSSLCTYSRTSSTFSTLILTRTHKSQHNFALVLHNSQYNSSQQKLYPIVKYPLPQNQDTPTIIPTARPCDMRAKIHVTILPNNILPTQHQQKKKPTCCNLLCYNPPNSPRHLPRYTSTSVRQRLTITGHPTMSIYSSISGSPTSQPSLPSRMGTPLYRKALISDTPDEDKELTDVILSGWVRTNTPISVGQDVVLHLTNGLTGSRVTDPHARIHIISQKIREPSTRDQHSDSSLFSTYQGLPGYAFLGLSATLKEYVLEWPISYAQFASKSSISFLCHPMPGSVAKPFATYSLRVALSPRKA